MSPADASLQSLHDLNEDGPIEEAAQLLIQHTVSMRASDLFFASDESALMVSYRQLGQIKPIRPFSIPYGKRLINHVKVMAGIDLGDRHRPTEGRWIFERDGQATIDLRINCMPTIHGEDVSVRLLDRRQGLIPLESFGLLTDEYDAIMRLLSRTGGLILVTGPTGSGKSTTLYSCLQHLNDGTRKINTLEDPVEYLVKGIRQSQVNPKMGVDFAELLSACLRQSPDVIMLGEIRDPRTAQTAVRAANSGHLVLATLHAPIAIKAVGSMVNLDVSPQSFGESLLGIISQRLVPKLCQHCKQRIDMSLAPDFLEDLRGQLPSDWEPSVYSPGQCDECLGSGFQGPICVPEILTINHELRSLIAARHPITEIHEAARRSGMITFRQSAMLRVALGLTTIEEVMRVIPFDELKEAVQEDWRDELSELGRSLAPNPGTIPPAPASQEVFES